MWPRTAVMLDVDHRGNAASAQVDARANLNSDALVSRLEFHGLSGGRGDDANGTREHEEGRSEMHNE